MKEKKTIVELTRCSVEEYRDVRKLPFRLLLDDVRSMQNVGSMLRTSDAFLVEEVIMAGITGIPPHKEISKTALGAEDSVAWRYVENSLEECMRMKKDGWTICVLEQTHDSIDLMDFSAEKGKKYLLVVGNEVKGVDQRIVDIADVILEIPMHGVKHSLNVAVSAGMAIFQLTHKISILSSPRPRLAGKSLLLYAFLHFIVSLCFLSSFPVMAVEDIPFNGLILDHTMQPVRNAKVYVRNPKIYTRTDKKGRFGLTNVLPDDTLTIEIKKKPKIRIPVEGRKSIRILLAGDGETPTSEYDEEIANTGYGYVQRREYTGVSSGISGARLRATGAHDILGALKGLVPGLNITGSMGNYSVDIRGKKSFMLSSEPIYIVDGVQLNSIDHISLYDVDHVEVLKDASQYGSRGANGAILVTTKTGLKN